MIVDRIKELSRFGEIIPGDKKERKLASYIKKMFEKCDEVNIFPITVLNYSENHEISGREKLDAEYLPYSPSVDFQGKLTRSVNECNESRAIVFNINHLYEINKYYRLALIRNCGAIVFITDKKRKFVVKTIPYLNLHPNPPPPIPAIIVPQNEISKLENQISVKAKVSIKESTGYIIEAIKNSKTEKKIYITAHHDHFFQGEHDNLLAVSILPEFSSNNFELHLVSFTAEELGALGYPSFSWSYGSRQFTNKFLQELDNIILNINLDSIDPKKPITKTVPGLLTFLKELEINPNKEMEIYSDGYSFIKKGVPSITVEGQLINYHSSDDIVDPSEEIFITELINRINKLLASPNIQINLNEVRDEIVSETKHIPLSMKSALVNIIDNLNYDIYKELLKLYGGILRIDKNFAQVELFHKIAGLANINGVTYLEGKPAIEISSFDEEYLKELRREFEQEYLDIIYKISEKFL